MTSSLRYYIVFNSEIAKLCEENDDISNSNTESAESILKNINISSKKAHSNQKNNSLNPKNNQKYSNNKVNTSVLGEYISNSINDSKTDEKIIDNLDTISNNNKQDSANKRNPNPAKFFDNFMWTTLNPQNLLDNGIIYLCKELNLLSKSNDYKKYPTATSIIMRALLESSLIYYANINTQNGVLRDIAKTRNGKFIGYEPLEKIINRYLQDANKPPTDNYNIFYNKKDLARYFKAFASSSGTKDYFDLIIHHPGKVVATHEALESIANSGFKAFIEEILN